MAVPSLGGEPYPEPAEPPAAPGEVGPSNAPQEEPPAAPFDDTGRPTDLIMTDMLLAMPGLPLITGWTTAY